MSRRTDPAPFEPAMPAAVRAIIAEARDGRGPAVAWLTTETGGWGQIGECFGLLRGRPEPLPAEIVGWLCGMSMFVDDLDALSDVILREHKHAVIAYAIDAFAAGLQAGVPTMKRQWKAIEKIAAKAAPLPASVASVIPIGCCLDQGLARGVALQLAHQLGEPARVALVAARATADKRAARRLDAALVALAGGRPPIPDAQVDVPVARSTATLDTLLESLLAAWRACHDPELEALIARLGSELARARDPITARSKGELEATWLARAVHRHAPELDVLLATPWPGAWKTALARVVALGKFAPDPRISTKLVELAKSYASWASEPLHREIARVVALAPSASLLAGIAAIDGARYASARIYEAARAASAGLQAGTADPALLAAAREALPSRADTAALLAQVHANPGDPGLRAVLADALLEAGDPRGELIALQCAIAAGTADAAARKRAAALLEAHIDEWTGPLPEVERASRRFERGFLVALRSSANTAQLEAAFDRPEWSTVEELILDGINRCDLGALVRRMPVLRSLTTSSTASLDDLAASGPFPALRALGCGDWLPARRDGFPNLAVVAVRGVVYGDGWRVFDDHVVRARRLGLDALVVTGFGAADLARAVSGRAVGPRELRFAISCDDYNRGVAANGWHVRVRRDEPAVDIAWGGGDKYRRDYLTPILAALAEAGLVAVAIHVGRARATVEDAIAGADARLAIQLDAPPIDLAAPIA